MVAVDEKGKPSPVSPVRVEGPDEERRQREAEVAPQPPDRARGDPRGPRARPARPMLATYGSALLIVIASLYVGRAFFALLGRRETHWLETPVGLAVLLVVCSVLTRSTSAPRCGLYPRACRLALIACAVLLVGSIAYLRSVRRPRVVPDRRARGRAQPARGLDPVHLLGPFGRARDRRQQRHGAHLIFADWLQNPTGPVPGGIAFGYPIGPHGMVATISEASAPSRSTGSSAY